MPIVFALGLRAGGADRLAALLRADGRFTCWDDPLAPIPPAPREGHDPAAALRTLRDRLVDASAGTLRPDDFAHGAPIDTASELRPGWPEHIRDYVRDLATASDNVVVTFTRASCKVPDLAVIAPDAHVLQIVDDPRRFVTRHLGRRVDFFSAPTEPEKRVVDALAMELVAARPDLAEFARAPAVVNGLLLWRELTTRTWDDIRARFPGRHGIVLVDDLVADPWTALRGIHGVWGGRPRLRQRLRIGRGGTRHGTPVTAWHEQGAPAWEHAFGVLGLTALLRSLAAAAVSGGRTAPDQRDADE